MESCFPLTFVVCLILVGVANSLWSASRTVYPREYPLFSAPIDFALNQKDEPFILVTNQLGSSSAYHDLLAPKDNTSPVELYLISKVSGRWVKDVLEVDVQSIYHLQLAITQHGNPSTLYYSDVSGAFESIDFVEGPSEPEQMFMANLVSEGFKPEDWQVEFVKHRDTQLACCRHDHVSALNQCS